MDLLHGIHLLKQRKNAAILGQIIYMEVSHIILPFLELP
jgi:hypothetical protein